ncbi:hypothetical protein PR048_021968 [Dryococelus australis]|uniref:Integrase catalytic domain-containing protein n=1 Tax=Dryococelus australis TaxID=614101 RepID=A0ABQ9GZP9_9NEOP|nr:hypothetical protein PR048_021968 [Dryococelus australis]
MFQNNNTKETLINIDIPTREWQQVHIDLFEFQTCTYLLLIDAYSRCPEVRLLTDLTRKTVVDNIMSIFAVNRIPDIVYTDQEPHFVNKDFRKFATDSYFSHVTNSPTYSQSNGLVEIHVQTIERLFKKAAQNGANIYLSLLEYRNTQIEPGLPSPPQLLNSRRLSRLVPMSESVLTTKIETSIISKLEQFRLQQKAQYGRQAKDLPLFQVEQKVQVSRGDTWQSGLVVGWLQRQGSYKVLMENGHLLERNIRHMIKDSRYPELSNFEDMDTALTVERENEMNTFNEQLYSEQSVSNRQMSGDNSTELAETTARNCVTKSGRIVNQPVRFKDNVT